MFRDIWLLLIFFDAHPIEHFFAQHACPLYHVGDESEDDELESDEEENRRCEEIIPIGDDFHIGEVEREENAKQHYRDEDEYGAWGREELHRTDVSERLDDNPRTVVYILPNRLHDAGLAIFEIGYRDRYPDELQILADGIDDGFLCIGEAGRVIEPEERFSIVRTKPAGEIRYRFSERATDEKGSQSVEFVFEEGDVLRAAFGETISDDHIRLMCEERMDHLLNIIRIELSVRIDVDQDVGAVQESTLPCRAEHHAEPAVAIVRNDDMRTALFRFFDSTIGRSIVNDLDEHFIDTLKGSRYPVNRFRDARFLIVCGHVDDELHSIVPLLIGSGIFFVDEYFRIDTLKVAFLFRALESALYEVALTLLQFFLARGFAFTPIICIQLVSEVW